MTTAINHKYYIFTPMKVVGGGAEALHQLAYYLRKSGREAYTVYYAYSGFFDAKPIDRYEQYEVVTTKYEDIEDEPWNYVIAPENAPWCLNSLYKAQKCIWWLGLIASEVYVGDWKYRLKYLRRRLLGRSVMSARKLLFNPKNCWHLCGSKYAYEGTRKRFPNSKVEYLVEPISLDFLRMGNSDLPQERADVVLYNPAKPSERMSQLLDRSKFNYVPLKGLTPVGLAEMYKKAKLYVDFGDFGGPERMPKEAVYFGCNILVANHNAATNDFDVAIPQWYKVDDGETAEQIESRIADMLEYYEIQHADFLLFKEKVERLEENFFVHIQNDFCKDE